MRKLHREKEASTQKLDREIATTEDLTSNRVEKGKDPQWDFAHFPVSVSTALSWIISFV